MSGGSRPLVGWAEAAAGLWLGGAAALALAGALPAWVPAAYGLASLAAYACYAADKARAEAGRRRLPERALHLLAAAGGWPGALVAQRRLRHKTRKAGFQAVFWLTALAHVGAAACWAYARWR
jgi:uncharacterized membrane protein YsdA (DUF1294 family)